MEEWIGQEIMEVGKGTDIEDGGINGIERGIDVEITGITDDGRRMDTARESEVGNGYKREDRVRNLSSKRE
ncbi:hypothetical protein J6590_051389 [Homalodisca vitripennis]|nr:hypothetical protein J6590_051389 [Homalodisca vitripennis]